MVSLSFHFLAKPHAPATPYLDVYKQSYFSALTFPNNMPAIWDLHWGFLRDTQPRAVVVGEWGGFCKGKDAKWQRRLARYLRERGMADNFCESFLALLEFI